MRNPVLPCLLGPLTLVFTAMWSMNVRADLPVAPDVEGKIAEALPNAAPAQPQQPRRILIYSKTWGFRHGSIPTGVKAFQMMGDRTRAYTAYHTEDATIFEADKLEPFDAIVMLNTTGECLAANEDEKNNPGENVARRKQNLLDFVASGKGLLGLHAATDTMYSSKEYGDLIGGWFTGHPWHTEVPMKIDAPHHPLTAMFDADAGFTIKDEIYQFAPRGDNASFNGYQPYSRSKQKVLLSLDTTKFDVSRGARNDGDYAISWVSTHGDGRVFYTVLGHNDFIFWHPVALKHYLAGLQYALGDLAADATPSETQPAAAN